MPKSIKVNLKPNPYKIIIVGNAFSRLGKCLKNLSIGRDAVIITNRPVFKRHGESLKIGLERRGFSVKIFEVPDGEISKSQETAFNLLEKIAKYDVKKKIFIVAFGGGVIGDLAGFIAAIYKRGIPYVQVPTTFLAQIDSAIGGKTAIDLSIGKNLIGAFYQPRVVWSDIAVLSTLDKRQMKNGLAEAVKYGVIHDRRLFLYLQKNFKKLLSFDSEALIDVIVSCSRIKAKVVASDERETKGIRTILNFGHTIGHAIEAAGDFRLYHHGEAVALGMRAAGNIAVELGLFNKKDNELLNCLLSNIGLPKKIRNLELSDILRIMQHDKKFQAQANRFVLPTKIGNVKVVSGVPERIIRRSVKALLCL